MIFPHPIDQRDYPTTITVIAWKDARTATKVGHVALQTYVGAECCCCKRGWEERHVLHDDGRAQGFYVSFYPGSYDACHVEACRKVNAGKPSPYGEDGHFHTAETDMDSVPQSSVEVTHLKGLDVAKIVRKIQRIVQEIPRWAYSGSGPFGGVKESNCANMVLRLLKIGGVEDSAEIRSLMTKREHHAAEARMLARTGLTGFFLLGMGWLAIEARGVTKTLSQSKDKIIEAQKDASKLNQDAITALKTLGPTPTSQMQIAKVEFADMLMQNSVTTFTSVVSDSLAVVEGGKKYFYLACGGALLVSSGALLGSFYFSQLAQETITPTDVAKFVKDVQGEQNG